jgi:hypothetical protein
VQLGLSIFNELDMIDQQDGVLFIKNWRKYQSEDKLEARRAKDRLRQERHRENERNKILALPPANLSRDHHVSLSRDVTPENRQEQNREEQSRKEQTTDAVRLLLQDTPLLKISDHDLRDLQQRPGIERLLQAADVAAENLATQTGGSPESWRLPQALCASLVVPEWYVPFAERQKRAKAMQQRKRPLLPSKKAIKAQEEAVSTERDALWNGLAEEEREHFRSLALADLPVGVNAAAGVVQILAKMKAWEARQVSGGS